MTQVVYVSEERRPQEQVRLLLSNFIIALTLIPEYWLNLGESVVFQGID